MCKARFDSQGMILNGFQKNIFEKTLMARSTPHPSCQLANANKNFHIFSTFPSHVKHKILFEHC